ncbi:c-type cytochrome [Celeribacter halophilus]|uniref:c-type cytochrome n=1 Tax=Celeribacter halophilus TaxID=576117 RepID=UPI001C093F67|nr:cytochrome c [Celeribacter halophilus]MBU2891400.1 cytochrome c [Celeribacter halophilus]MDO6512415.1 cytochrome c [Celeribacter halophilus]
MNKLILPLAGAAIVALAAYVFFKPEPTPATTPLASSSRPAQGDSIVAVALPDTLSANAQIGKRAFDSVCAACHGENAAGKEGFGPPLVHKIYEPSHHGDLSFLMAAQRGVQAHHWRFGNMPPQEGVTQGDVKAIISYVRELQRANGIN